MLENFKLGMKLLKYGFKIKQNIFFLILILAIGIVVEVISKGTNMIGGFYILLIGMFIHQMIISLNLSTLIQTSKIKKATQTSMPAITSFILYAVMLTVLSVEKYILVLKKPEMATDLKMAYLTVVLMFVAALIYSGLAYKYYVASMLAFFVMVMCITIFVEYNVAAGNTLFVENIDMLALIGIAYVLFLVGLAIEYGLSLLAYKKEISPIAFKGLMKKLN